MELNKDLVKHLAKTARLNLTPGEIEEFLPQLKEILEAFSELSEIDTKDIEPSYQPLNFKNKLREDLDGKCLKQKEALKNTKNKKNGYFKGPKVV